MLEIAPPWVASVITVGVFVVTTAVGFLLMRIAFNARPVFGRQERKEAPPERAAAVDGDRGEAGS